MDIIYLYHLQTSLIFPPVPIHHSLRAVSDHFGALGEIPIGAPLPPLQLKVTMKLKLIIIINIHYK